jgi:large repetitive protein
MADLIDVSRSNGSALNAKLHQGYDPSIEYKEQGNLLSAVQYETENQQNVPVLAQILDGFSNALKSIFNDATTLFSNALSSNNDAGNSVPDGSRSSPASTLSGGISLVGDAVSGNGSGGIAEGSAAQENGGITAPAVAFQAFSGANDIRTPGPSSSSNGTNGQNGKDGNDGKDGDDDGNGGTDPIDPTDPVAPLPPVISAPGSQGNENTPVLLGIGIAADPGSITTIIIGNIPVGGSLTAGINNGDGTWTVTPAQLVGLALIPPLYSSGMYTLSVTAFSVENGLSAQANTSFPVLVQGIATTPTLAVVNATGNENSAVPLEINAVLVDIDGSETVSIVISNVPPGAMFSAGTNNGNGSWTFTPAQLIGLNFTPPLNASGHFNLSVTAIAAENNTTASANAILSVDISGIATTPIVTVTPSSGDEDTLISLSINAALAVNDGSETLSIVISNVPNGAILSAGINNGNGSWTLTPAQLIGLTLTPALNLGNDINLIVTAIASENGHTASASEILHIDVHGVADIPVLAVQPAKGTENTAIALTINAALTDTDRSETLSIVISGVPAGAILSAGVNNGNGSWTLTPTQLTGLTITPPVDWSGHFNLTVTATSSEESTTSSVTQTLGITVIGEANTPLLTVNAAVGAENTPIALSIGAALTDNDGSETLSIVISNVPAGAVLSAGLYGGNGTWTLTPAQLVSLTITPPNHYSGTITLQVTAVATENDGDTALTQLPCLVTVTPVVSVPVLNVQGVIGNEDQPIALDINASVADSSETLSIMISGVPTGAVLSAGINNNNGTWTLTAAQLAGLTITPPPNSDADMALTVIVTATETDGSTAVTSSGLLVTVHGVADVPNVTASNSAGAIDTQIAVNVNGSLNDTDGSESLTFVVGGVPDGFRLTAGLNNGDGTWTLTQSQLAGLKLVSPYYFEGRIHLSAVAVSHENDGDVVRSLPTRFHIDVGNPLLGLEIDLELGIGVAGIGLGVGIGVGATIGNILNPAGVVIMEDSPLLLSGITTLLSNVLSTLQLSLLADVRLSGLPTGASLSVGTNLGGGVWSLAGADLNAAYLTTPPNSDQDFTLTLQATLLSLVTINLTTVAVHVVGVADIPTLSVANAIGNEGDASIAISVSSALTDSDGSEILSILIKDLPPGFQPTLGINNGDGTWSIPVAQLGSLAIKAPDHFSGDATYTIVAVSTEREGDTSTHTITGHIHVNPVADAPVISPTDMEGIEGQALELSLGINLLDTYGSDHLSNVLISGVPIGAVLSHGVDHHDGSWSIHPIDLGHLTFTPPPFWHGDLTLNVAATSQESVGGSIATTTSSIMLHIDAKADTPLLSLSHQTGISNTPIELHINAALIDTDGSEHLSVLVMGVPEGGILSAGLHNGDGSWTLHADELTHVSLIPPTDFSGDINLSVTALSHEASNGSSAHVTANMTVSVEVPILLMNFMSFDSQGDQHSTHWVESTSGANDFVPANDGTYGNDADAFTHQQSHMG